MYWMCWSKRKPKNTQIQALEYDQSAKFSCRLYWQLEDAGNLVSRVPCVQVYRQKSMLKAIGWAFLNVTGLHKMFNIVVADYDIYELCEYE